jgi:Zn-dependent protease
MSPVYSTLSEKSCSSCGTTLAADALSCPECRALVHAEQLEDLARKAQIAANGGNWQASRDFWRQSLAFLPPDTVQAKSIQARVAELDVKIGAAAKSAGSANAAGEPKGFWKKGAAGLGPIAVLFWKFKAILFGLAKMSTLLSMVASLGIYWAAYGWVFALGLVCSIYIHEMGHVIELRKFGIPAGAPVFIPFLGAIIQLRGVNLPPVQDARIGLAGPIYGLATAAVSLLLYYITGSQAWAVVANLGGYINLFNLIPVWQLDGARGFHSQTRNQRLILLAFVLALFWWSSTGILLLIALGAGYCIFFQRNASEEPDHVGFTQFAVLLVALTAIIVVTKDVAR